MKTQRARRGLVDGWLGHSWKRNAEMYCTCNAGVSKALYHHCAVHGPCTGDAVSFDEGERQTNVYRQYTANEILTTKEESDSIRRRHRPGEESNESPWPKTRRESQCGTSQPAGIPSRMPRRASEQTLSGSVASEHQAPDVKRRASDLRQVKSEVELDSKSESAHSTVNAAIELSDVKGTKQLTKQSSEVQTRAQQSLAHVAESANNPWNSQTVGVMQSEAQAAATAGAEPGEIVERKLKHQSKKNDESRKMQECFGQVEPLLEDYKFLADTQRFRPRTQTSNMPTTQAPWENVTVTRFEGAVPEVQHDHRKKWLIEGKSCPFGIDGQHRRFEGVSETQEQFPRSGKKHVQGSMDTEARGIPSAHHDSWVPEGRFEGTSEQRSAYTCAGNGALVEMAAPNNKCNVLSTARDSFPEFSQTEYVQAKPQLIDYLRSSNLGFHGGVQAEDVVAQARRKAGVNSEAHKARESIPDSQDPLDNQWVTTKMMEFKPPLRPAGVESEASDCSKNGRRSFNKPEWVKVTEAVGFDHYPQWWRSKSERKAERPEYTVNMAKQKGRRVTVHKSKLGLKPKALEEFQAQVNPAAGQTSSHPTSMQFAAGQPKLAKVMSKKASMGKARQQQPVNPAPAQGSVQFTQPAGVRRGFTSKIG